MARYIDAEKAEKDGWSASRTYPQDAHTMVYETKKMTDFPTADVVERKKGKWETEIRTIHGYKIPFPVCSVCGKYAVDEYIYCPNCGAQMKSE